MIKSFLWFFYWEKTLNSNLILEYFSAALFQIKLQLDACFNCTVLIQAANDENMYVSYVFRCWRRPLLPQRVNYHN